MYLTIVLLPYAFIHNCRCLHNYDDISAGLDSKMQAELFGGGAAEVTLSAHVANSTVPKIKLFHGRVLSTLAERRLLHVTEVEDIRRRGHIRYKIGQVGN